MPVLQTRYGDFRQLCWPQQIIKSRRESGTALGLIKPRYQRDKQCVNGKVPCNNRKKTPSWSTSRKASPIFLFLTRLTAGARLQIERSLGETGAHLPFRYVRQGITIKLSCSPQNGSSQPLTGTSRSTNPHILVQTTVANTVPFLTFLSTGPKRGKC